MTDAESKRIRITRNGPYLVSGTVPLSEEIIVSQDGDYRMQPGRVFRITGSYALCRCGQSSQMPFCDGSHARFGFDGTETAARIPFRDCAGLMQGPGLTLADNEPLCALARFCHTHAGTVWELTEQSADPAARQLAIAAAAACPSGRLIALAAVTGAAVENDYEPSIVVIQDPEFGVSGPLWVRGGIPVVSADGETYEVRNRVTLCRCGQSRNKPFCDAGHVRSGFREK